MNPAILAAFARGHGLITRYQALDLGVSPNSINHHVRRGDWVPVRRGVYADAEVWNALDIYRGRPLLRARAALLMMRRQWVLSHDSAAHAHGLDILRADPEFVHVTRGGYTNAWTKAGVKHHLAHYSADQVSRLGDLPSLDLARTVVDIARERGVVHGVVAADAAMRRGLDRAALWTAVAPMVSWPYVTGVRTAIELADPGAQSVAESLGRLFVQELGIGRPETQFPVQTENGVAWLDLLVGCHAFEIDGRVKYRAVEDGGVATSSADQVVWDEKLRERLVSSQGLGFSRIVWADFWGTARAAARTRVRAEWEVTVARFGTELPEHLIRNAAEIRARRHRSA